MSIPGLRIDPDGNRPVYRQIADGVRAALLERRLLPGRQLPPTRELARELGVNRNTVVAAYELLAADGVVRSHTGRGTFLAPAGDLPAETRRQPTGSDEAWFTSFSRAVEGPGVGNLLSIYRLATSTEGISFAGSYPASDLMPVEEFGKALAAAVEGRAAEILGYGPTAGFPPLRESIATDMGRRGSRVTAEEVLVTNGSQQALEIVFRSLLDPGDPVILEDPTYTGALSALGSLGVRLVGVPVDGEGIRSDLLAVALERHRPKLMYLQPTFHNPATHVMGEARRREVLALAERYRCAVVEDDWAGDLRFEGPEPPTLHALDGGRHVIYLSTFSKKLLPGLRVGWVAAPRPVFRRLLALKQIEDCGTSPLVQAALHEFLRAGGLESHLERVRSAYRERRDRMLSALDRCFPPEVSWTRPRGGLFLWVSLPAGVDSSELFLAARERGVLFSRGELFHVEGDGRRTLRLAFAAPSPEAIDEGVGILGSLIEERRGRRTPGVDGRVEAVPVL